MAYFAVMSGNTVSNVIVADTLADAEAATNATCIEYTETNPAGIGNVWDEATNTFTKPEVAEV